jgi:hypothetical protein
MNAATTRTICRAFELLSAGDWVAVRATSQKPRRQRADSLPGTAHTSMSNSSSAATTHAAAAHWHANGARAQGPRAIQTP